MSELNGNGIQLRDMSKIELSSNGSTNKIRPTDLNLKPFKLPTLPEDGYLEPEESTSSSAASSISNKYFKRIDIGFSDLSYSVKTGIFKQGECTPFLFQFCLFLLFVLVWCSNVVR